MKTPPNPSGRGRQAYTLIEVVVSVAVIGVLFGGLYLAFSAGFTVIRVARENLRATQIMVQRMEAVRLYTWTQLLDPAYFKLNFTDNAAPLGVTYYGTIALTQDASLPATYQTDMRTVTITLNWTNRAGVSVPHTRSMQTQVARYGIQNYVYGSR
jgi:prepilin-type N-terminal cleavage/methylation domain-containing protein